MVFDFFHYICYNKNMKETEKEIIEKTFQIQKQFKNVQSVFPLHNEIDVPKTSGLYMLAEKIMPFDFNEEVIYLIKIGQGKNLQRRLNQYKSMNPGAQCIAFTLIHQVFLNDMEKDWLSFFENRYPSIDGTKEWFMVPKEDYERYCKFGFNA